MTAAMAGLLATAISILLPGNSFVIIASVLGASLGFAVKKYSSLQSGEGNAGE